MSLVAPGPVLLAAAPRRSAPAILAAAGLALLSLVAVLAPTDAEAAFACRTVDGRRTCGVVPSQPRTSAVPNPGVSPSQPRAPGPTGAVTRPRPACGPNSVDRSPC
jgi:hypothetical protein